MEILLVILGLVLFVALVVVHEWGHFIMARRKGVEVEEFGVGFPPKLFTFYKDKKGTEYTINLLPLGGFVRLKGEHDADKTEGSFGAARFSGKVKIILAGVVMNLFTAWLMLTILAFVGIPKLPLPGGEEQFTVKSDTKVVSNEVYIGYVEPNGPADKAGVKTGDQLLFLTDTSNPPGKDLSGSLEFTTPNSVIAESTELRISTEKLLNSGAEELSVWLIRDGKDISLNIVPRSIEEVATSRTTDSPKGYLGVIPYDYTVRRSTWSAPIVGAGLVAQYSRITYSTLGSSVASLFKGKPSEAGENVSGPIGIFVVLKEGASLGPSYILLIIALLSLTLAIMNTLPIPALDGGKLAVMLVYRVLNKPLAAKTEEAIHGTGFFLLMLLFVVITVVDVRRFF